MASDGKNDNEQDWELKKETKEIKVYTRDYKDSNIKEFKAIVTVKASVSKVKSIIDDVENSPKWMYEMEQMKVIKKYNGKVLTYSEIKTPWPMDNRDIVAESSWDTLTDNSLKCTITAKPEQYPEQDNITRIREADGYWLLTPLDNNTTKVTYRFYANPAGGLPKWIINLFIVDGPFETLKNLRQVSQDE